MFANVIRYEKERSQHSEKRPWRRRHLRWPLIDGQDLGKGCGRGFPRGPKRKDWQISG